MTNLVCIDANENDAKWGTEQAEDSLLQQLRESDRRITENGSRFNKASMEIGWDGFFIKQHQGWRLLGYEDEHRYRQAKGIGRSTWYKMVGIAERLSHLTRENFLAMTVENAEQLSEQPMSMKETPELILKAQTESSEKFADSLVAHEAARSNTPAKDVPVIMKFHVRQSQRKVIERGLQEWEHAHGIDDPGYALELMIAEFRERLTFVGFISESIVRLSRAVTAAHTPEELEDLRQLFAAHLKEMGELLKICSGEPGSEEDESAA